jgi:hypothetical protein
MRLGREPHRSCLRSARASGWPASHLRRSVERGERNIGIDNPYALADALGVSPRDML